MSKCCYYERGQERKTICTTDDKCPALAGWALVGSWNVEDCDDCFKSAQFATVLEEGLPAALRDVAALQLAGPLFVSAKTIQGLKKFVKRAPPRECHLEVVVGEDESITFRCVGDCPNGQACGMTFNRENDNVVVSCECQ